MKFKLRSLIGISLAVSAFATVLALGGSSAGATGNTWVVDDDGFAISGNCDNGTTVAPMTISAAITTAAAGDTIKVCPGTYPEIVTVNKSLTLKGAKAGSNVNSRTFPSVNESTVTGNAGPATIEVEAADVTIDGFSISNVNQALGIRVKTAGNNAVIKNNIIEGVGGASFALNTVGVYLELGPDNVKVEKNKISNVKSIPSAQGILIGDSSSPNPSLGVRIDGNKISDITSVSNGAYGIQLNNGAFVTSLPRGYTTGKIISNDISNLTGGGWAHGIGLEGDTPNLVVKYNTIKNLTDLTPASLNNAVGVTFESNLFFFTVDVNQNSLDVTSAGYGIGVNPTSYTLYPTLSVDGTCNWWGNKTGPGPGLGSVGTGTGSMVTAGVDFKPWLKTSNLKHGRCGDKGHGEYNDYHYGHGNDDKDRWYNHND